MQFKYLVSTLIVIHSTIQTLNYTIKQQYLPTGQHILNINAQQLIKIKNEQIVRNQYGDAVQVVERSENTLLKAKHNTNITVYGPTVVQIYVGIYEDSDGHVVGHSYITDYPQQHTKQHYKYECMQGYSGKYCLLPVVNVKIDENEKILNRNRINVLYFQQQYIKIRRQSQQQLDIRICIDNSLKKCSDINENGYKNIIKLQKFYLVVQYKKNINKSNSSGIIKWQNFHKSLRKQSGPQLQYQLRNYKKQKYENIILILLLGIVFTVLLLICRAFKINLLIRKKVVDTSIAIQPIGLYRASSLILSK